VIVIFPNAKHQIMHLIGFFELNNGCICCTVKDDLLATLEQLVLHKDRFDYVLIETTGELHKWHICLNP
jgi:G3E family GTPase